MKKSVLLGICAILIIMPILSAAPINTKNNFQLETINKPLDEEYDGTFVGGLGQIYKENGEWQYEIYSYIAGGYKDNNYKILFGNFYNLDEEQIGTIVMIKAKFFLIGRISNLEGKKLPIVGFIFENDDDQFIGRLMSIIGPAPYMWGKYTPN